MGKGSGCGRTLGACYLGYVTQAVVNNLAPLLFLTFQNEFSISFEKIAVLSSFNFAVQLAVDLAAARFADRIGYRVCIVSAHLFAAAGIAGLGLFPRLTPDPFWGLLLAVALYAVGGGLIEVLVSPIAEACPTPNKASVMSFLHSFYCWGQVLTVALSTLFFSLAGMERWPLLPLLWAAVPLAGAACFSRAPLFPLTPDGKSLPLRSLLRRGSFWLFILLLLCSGAAEQGMSQWASAFAEAGLGISKAAGDLAGPCLFAVMMGLARVVYARFGGRLRLPAYMAFCGVLCLCSYLLAAFSPLPLLALAGCGLCGFSVGVLWPGSFSLASARIPAGGTALFSLLALAGDLGCSAGPALVGAASGAAGGNLRLGLAAGVLFPAVLLAALPFLRKNTSQ
ncbi:MAG: MFS transporter [Oscillospiraceae bacterium]|nr:MFS transporter [Oscillospiraceae bacterium]